MAAQIASTSDTAVTDAEPWLSALRALIPMPEAYRRFDVDRISARGLLGCQNELLDRLLQGGIPHCGAGDAVRFDYNDLANVALYSGAATSVPLAGQRMMVRYASGAPGTWTSPRRWKIDWRLGCHQPHCPGGEWRVALPAPDVFGGRIEELSCDQECSQQDGTLIATGNSEVRLTGLVTTAGRRRPLRSGAAREVFDELLDDLLAGRYRFQWMHPSLRTDRAAVEVLRIMDCTVCALEIQRRLTSLGLTARTRRGRLLGVLDVEHSWAEVLDEDGVFKPIDPVLALHAIRHRRGQAEFVDFCAGSIPSRFLPWAVAAGEPLARHRCRIGDGSWDSTFSGTATKGQA